MSTLRSKWIGITAAFMLMLCTYVLSYAPYVAFRYEGPQYSSPSGGWACTFYPDEEPYYHPPFAPVEWLIDHTPLQEPLLVWGRVWGSDDKMRFDILLRVIDNLENSEGEFEDIKAEISYPLPDTFEVPQ